MAKGEEKGRGHERWAQLRFSIVGPLLASPPGRGELAEELRQLAAKTWRHPITGKPKQFAMSTIERWLYQARAAEADPIGSLRRKIREDSGQARSVSEALERLIRQQHKEHPNWSYQLHYDNLVAIAATESSLRPLPSYSTVRRLMRARGLIRHRRIRNTPGAERAARRLELREVRGFEHEHVHGLWHLDFHQGSCKVVTQAGTWATPMLLGILDDHSRLGCHLQWYLHETAENLVHGLCQAIQKRGLPRKLMTDNGAAMLAAETTEGLGRLSISHDTTLPASPYQNGKQEVFWAQIEGRVVPMLEGVDSLTLPLLNEATLAWLEQEYNRKRHSELGEAPLTRYVRSQDVGRPSPSSDDLRLAFTMDVTRTQRRSDGTITIDRRRFEIPNAYRHMSRISVRYARWDLSVAHLVDPRTGKVLCRLFPQDKSRNADGRRRVLQPGLFDDPDPPRSDGGIAPLLVRYMAEQGARGLPPAYLPKDEDMHDNSEELR